MCVSYSLVVRWAVTHYPIEANLNYEKASVFDEGIVFL